MASPFAFARRQVPNADRSILSLRRRGVIAESAEGVRAEQPGREGGSDQELRLLVGPAAARASPRELSERRAAVASPRA